MPCAEVNATVDDQDAPRARRRALLGCPSGPPDEPVLAGEIDRFAIG